MQANAPRRLPRGKLCKLPLRPRLSPAPPGTELVDWLTVTLSQEVSDSNGPKFTSRRCEGVESHCGAGCAATPERPMPAMGALPRRRRPGRSRRGGRSRGRARWSPRRSLRRQDGELAWEEATQWLRLTLAAGSRRLVISPAGAIQYTGTVRHATRPPEPLGYRPPQLCNEAVTDERILQQSWWVR
jgi:hypothetical protein